MKVASVDIWGHMEMKKARVKVNVSKNIKVIKKITFKKQQPAIHQKKKY